VRQWSENDLVLENAIDEHCAAVSGVRSARNALAFEDARDGSNVLFAACWVKDAQYGDQRGFPTQQEAGACEEFTFRTE
jgi:hypothetical protein